ncbi:uncharacterized protein LOC125472882 [Pyrus x bretschneideri]|uniref:uncharacterized protein LOC125472882 n=1 Tax=Pyrus x bretschneideri TaxID=225117 RepID=UPI00202F3BC3|nr:uncharacterized protein LOC125472882 [Pyrus x bretschneideri]
MESAAWWEQELRRLTPAQRTDWNVFKDEFYEILLRVEDSENMSSDSDEEKNGNRKKDDKGKGQTSLGPRQTQNFKRGGASSSSSSGGFSASGQGRGGRFYGGRGGAYHYQGDVVPYAPGQYQYPQDPYSQGGYPPYPSNYMPYPPAPTGGSQWYQGGQYQQGENATSSAGSSRQMGQPSQGRGAQGRGVQASRDLPGLPPDRDVDFTVELLPALPG